MKADDGSKGNWHVHGSQLCKVQADSVNLATVPGYFRRFCCTTLRASVLEVKATSKHTMLIRDEE